MIRTYELHDEITVKRIHEKYYKEEFSAPKFTNKFLCAFVIENNEGDIVSIGGVRPILESVIVTDKDKSPKERMDALYSMLEASAFVGTRHGFDQLHAFIHDPKWSNRLQRSFKFRPTKGQSLYLDI